MAALPPVPIGLRAVGTAIQLYNYLVKLVAAITALGSTQSGGPVALTLGQSAPITGATSSGVAGVCVHVLSGGSLLQTNGNAYTCGDAGATNVAGTVYGWDGGMWYRGAYAGFNN